MVVEVNKSTEVKTEQSANLAFKLSKFTNRQQPKPRPFSRVWWGNHHSVLVRNRRLQISPWSLCWKLCHDQFLHIFWCSLDVGANLYRCSTIPRF